MKHSIPLITLAALIAAPLLITPMTVSASGEFTDTRIKVDLSEKWRTHLLYEMRNGLMPTLQKIVQGVAAGDMKAVAKAARSRGMQQKMNKNMMAEIPMGMKRIGKPMHMGFDAIANAAESGKGSAAVMNELSKLMEHCTACHNTYKFQ